MAAFSRRNQHRTDIWPGFVDALATLLMVIIFLLMIFVIAQFFLNDALSGRDQALDRLRNQVSELADLLSLERDANTDLRGYLRGFNGTATGHGWPIRVSLASALVVLLAGTSSAQWHTIDFESLTPGSSFTSIEIGDYTFTSFSPPAEVE